jgi:hypothetical protein
MNEDINSTPIADKTNPSTTDHNLAAVSETAKPAIAKKRMNRQNRFIPSAFKVVYFIAFLLTIVQIGWAGAEKAQEVVPTILSTTVDKAIFQAIIVGFLLFVMVHLVRIYFTLERLEKEREPFHDFYKSFSQTGIWIEFAARFILVAIVTFKAFSPLAELNTQDAQRACSLVECFVLTINQFFASLVPTWLNSVFKYLFSSNLTGVFATLPLFLLVLYFFLLIWGVIAQRFGGKDRRQAFINSSLSGLAGAFTIAIFLPRRDSSVIVGVVLLALCTGYLFWDLKYNSNWRTYVKRPLEAFF